MQLGKSSCPGSALGTHFRVLISCHGWYKKTYVSYVCTLKQKKNQASLELWSLLTEFCYFFFCVTSASGKKLGENQVFPWCGMKKLSPTIYAGTNY